MVDKNTLPPLAIKQVEQFRQKKKDTADPWVTYDQTKSKDSRDKLLESLSPVVNSALTTFAGGDQGLKTRAFILANQSIDSYDPTRGASIGTHVFNNLRRLSRYKAERGSVVHIPEKDRLERMQLQRMFNEYVEQNGTEPSYSWLAEKSAVPQRRIASLMKPMSETVSSLLTTDKGDDFGNVVRGKEDIWLDYVYFDLDEPNKKIFEWSTGYMGSKVLPKKDIAQKLGISPAAVSQRINTITKKLEKLYTDSDYTSKFKPYGAENT